jgi:2-polyprenyl-3-methyl-5-hydroxy-6-metoxy-1,4-benzoquinol methylase
MATDSNTPDHTDSADDDPVERTIRWYDHHAEDYAERTRQTDLSDLRDRFLEQVPEGGHVLDVGCGAGRDTKAFLKRGYEVTAFDASEEMVRLASEYTGQKAYCRRIREVEPSVQYDGIWACASLVHVPVETLPYVFKQIAGWLRPTGTLYSSFSTGKRQDSARFFNAVSQGDVVSLIDAVEMLQVREIWNSGDAEGRDQIQWMNVLAQRRASRSSK